MPNPRPLGADPRRARARSSMQPPSRRVARRAWRPARAPSRPSRSPDTLKRGAGRPHRRHRRRARACGARRRRRAFAMPSILAAHRAHAGPRAHRRRPRSQRRRASRWRWSKAARATSSSPPTTTSAVRRWVLAPRAPETRVATGFDAHRWGPGDVVWLCGVEMPARRAAWSAIRTPTPACTP